MFFYNRFSKFSKRLIRVVADICISRKREFCWNYHLLL